MYTLTFDNFSTYTSQQCTQIRTNLFLNEKITIKSCTYTVRYKRTGTKLNPFRNSLKESEKKENKEMVYGRMWCARYSVASRALVRDWRGAPAMVRASNFIVPVIRDKAGLFPIIWFETSVGQTSRESECKSDIVYSDGTFTYHLHTSATFTNTIT